MLKRNQYGSHVFIFRTPPISPYLATKAGATGCAFGPCSYCRKTLNGKYSDLKSWWGTLGYVWLRKYVLKDLCLYKSKPMGLFGDTWSYSVSLLYPFFIQHVCDPFTMLSFCVSVHRRLMHAVRPGRGIHISVSPPEVSSIYFPHWNQGV